MFRVWLPGDEFRRPGSSAQVSTLEGPIGEQHLSSVVTEPYLEDGDRAAPWTRAMDELHRASTFWVGTVHPTGRPHVVPVLAVVRGGTLHFAAGPSTQKARNLAQDPRVTITTSGDAVDVVVDGVVDAVRDDQALTDVAAAYGSKYGWQVEVREGRLYGDGAPTAGPPPYDVYRLTPHRAFGFPTIDDAPPTRWRFRTP